MLDDAERTLLNLLSRELGGEPVTLSLAHPSAGGYRSGSERPLPTLSCYLYDVREVPLSHNAPSSPQLPVSLLTRLQATWCISVMRAAGQIDTNQTVLADHALLGTVYMALWRNTMLTDDVLAGALAGPHANPVGRILPVPPLGDQFWAAFQARLRPAIHYAIAFSIPAG